MPFARRRAARALGPILFAVLVAVGCSRKPAPITLRLLDLFRPELVLGRSPVPPSPPPRTEWRFDAPPTGERGAGGVWEAGPGVAGLAVRDGRLQGRTTSPGSVVHLLGKPGPEGGDVLEEVEIRLRASAGANLFVSFSGQEHVDLAEVALQPAIFWSLATPIIA